MLSTRVLPGISAVRGLIQALADEKEVCAARRVDKPLILYGAGSLGRMAKDFLGKLDIPLLYVVDRNADRYGKSVVWDGISVVRPEEVPLRDRSEALLAVCISSLPYEPIATFLESRGWLDVVPFYDIAEAYRDRYPLGNGWFAGALDSTDLEGIQYVNDQWADDISRAHHIQFMAWRHHRKEMTFDAAPVKTDDRFFIPQILSSLHEKEVFLDGGAHHGEVSLRFLDTVACKFERIYAVEPDKFNIAALRNTFHDMNESARQKTEIIECALGGESGCLPFFHGLDYASQLSPLSDEPVPVQALDDMDLPATFIKLHLEGCELSALQGAIGTLNKRRPLLAVTTYHNRDGLWKLPAYLMKNLDSYLFLLRLHGWMGAGCVLYAIPGERFTGGRGTAAAGEAGG